MMARHALLVLVLTGLSAAGEVASERCLLYVVEHIAPGDAPAVDGKLDEPVWENRERIDTLRNFLGDRVGDFASQRSEFTVLCDGASLFIGATFHEAEMKKLKASPANAPFWNDCIEVYFDPRHDGTRSIQLVIDCIGQRMWAKKYDEGYGWWADKAWYMLADWEGKSARGTNAWTVEIRVDCASFEIDPTPGSVCGFNPCRFRLGAGDEFSAWTFSGSKRQKSIPAWGHLLFAGPGEKVRGRKVTADDITRIYGSLEGRCVEVPTAAGFTVFSDQATRNLTFGEKLADGLGQVDELVQEGSSAADAAAERMGGKHAFVSGLEKTLAETRKLLAEVRNAELTIGACDRFAAALEKKGAELDTAIWNARLAVLVADVQQKGMLK